MELILTRYGTETLGKVLKIQAKKFRNQSKKKVKIETAEEETKVVRKSNNQALAKSKLLKVQTQAYTQFVCKCKIETQFLSKLKDRD